MAIGDLNGDGRPDLVVANNDRNTVSILLGNGDGTYRAAVDYAVGSGPVWVAIGDLNGDGKPDLVVACLDNTFPVSLENAISVLLGNGDGTFRSAVKYQAGQGPTSVAIGDLNGDRKPDIVVTNLVTGRGPQLGNTVSVLLGNGDGTFKAAVDYAVGSRPNSVAIGDLNGDGKPDLVVANSSVEVGVHGNDVSVLLGNGDGTFRAAVNYPVGLAPWSVAIGDLNGDGKPDVVVANFGLGGGGIGDVSVLLGNGDGTLQAAVSHGAGSNPWSVAIGDMNGDGKPDIVVADLGDTVSVLLGSGDGTFEKNSYWVGGPLKSVAIGDLNGDGKLDIAVTDQGFGPFGGVAVLLNTPSQLAFAAAVSYAVGIRPQVVAIGDLNGDGKPDLIVGDAGGSSHGSGPGSVSVLLANGDGSFGAAVDYAVGAGGAGYIAIGDVNGDGKVDLVVATGGQNFGTGVNTSAIAVLLGNGDGTFQAAVTFPFASFPGWVGIRDLNGDGKPDLVVTTSEAPNVFVLLGNGDGTLQAPVSYRVGVSAGPVTVVDLDADRKLDLVVLNGDNTVSVLLGNGDGTFRPAVNYNVGPFAYAAAVGDLNGDGKPDLVVANNSGINAGGISVLLGNGDGTFQAAVTTRSPDGRVAIVDFNADGKPDIVILGTYLSVHLGNGDGTFKPPVSYSLGAAPWVAIGDLNGDGKLDLAVTRSQTGTELNDGPGTVEVLLNTMRR